MSPRTALTRWLIGLTSTNACSQPGMVSAATKTLLPNASGKISRNMIPCTAPGVRTIIPTYTEIQPKHSAKPMASAREPNTPLQLAGSNPMRTPTPTITVNRTT